MKRTSVVALLAIALSLALVTGCSKQITSAEAAGNDGSSSVPFHHSSQPTVTQVTVPAGTPVAIRMQTAVSSKTASAGQHFQAVLDELESAGVKLLVDVRAVVSSRRPGFSKNQLAAALDERGIGYIHMKGLGTPKEGRLAARRGDMKALERIYAKHLKTPQAREELDELSALVMKAGPVCILCYERDHQHCHRKWIAEIIHERDGALIDNLLPPQL